MKCAYCDKEIKDKYITCLDNFLQAKFFDSEEDNIFCSQGCVCKALSIMCVSKIELDKYE